MKSIVLFLGILSSIFSFGQKQIQGIVSDENGSLAYANVIVKHSSIGVSTDENGHFSIQAKPTDTLQVSYLGYTIKEVPVGKQKQLNILLDTYEELDEVVIISFSGFTTRCSFGCCCYAVISETLTSPNKDELVSMYPNPSRDGLFYLKVADDISEVNLMVADLSGRVIMDKSCKAFNFNISVDLSHQPTGLYLINVFSKGKLLTSKTAIRL